ncbi:MAG: PadR family transcriptional regulator [Oscillospiraceae bacterium]|jgi:PadR family transcriptional regulator PadR|nr:PadR family transcriptional regulator [Oscillospiraceae bacterium]
MYEGIVEENLQYEAILVDKTQDTTSNRSGTSASIKDLLKKATTEMLVLFVLRFKPMYTYEMMNLIEQISGGVLTFNTLYQAVYRLQKFHYIFEANKTISEDNRLRVYFSITAEGRVYFEQLVAEYRTVTDVIDNILARETLDLANLEGEDRK